MDLSEITLVPATGLGDNKFVGIKIENGHIEFHYPDTFELSSSKESPRPIDEKLRKDIVLVLRSVELARTPTSEKSSYNTRRKRENVFPLRAFLWIINDYLTYGRYINKERQYEHGVKGKINWKKTMRAMPAISSGNVVYSDIVSERKSQHDNLLSEIYFYCVQKSIDSIGWIYNLSFDNGGVNYYRLFNEKKYIGAINSELSKSFDDLKKMRLSNMKSVILGLDDSVLATKKLIYGVDSYEYVFEKMLDAMFSKVDRKSDFYPSAFWDVLYPKPDSVKSTNLRPDTISIRDRKVFILDAKYYQYGKTFDPRDLPETTSIQKQITYGEYIKKVKEGQYDDVFSAFVMPYNKHSSDNPGELDGDIEFIGIAKADWIDADEHSRKIAGILIDTRFLVENWIRGCDSAFSELTDTIEVKVGEARP